MHHAFKVLVVSFRVVDPRPWQEKEEALPIKNDDGQAEQPAPEVTGPRPFGEETMSKKQQKRIKKQPIKHYTPYSMNRLFSELFRKFGGGFLEVCEAI